MSSKLKKKNKDKKKIEEYIGITKQRTERFKQEKKEDDAVRAVSASLSCMTYLALLDVLGYKEKRLKKFQQKCLDLKSKWVSGKITTPELMYYCKKKNIKIDEWLKSIPSRHKIGLSSLTITSKEGAEIMEMAVQTHGLFLAVVLKEHFRATLKEIHAALEHMKASIGCYVTKQPKSKKPYLTDEDILQVFREEVKLDLETGEKIA